MRKWASVAICIAVIIGFLLLCRFLHKPSWDHIFKAFSYTDSPKSEMQAGRWVEAEIRPEAVIRLDKAVQRYLSNRDRYRVITGQRHNGVPAPVVFALHGRESGWSFKKHLHNGDPLTGRTYRVPAGRLPYKEPPYTFEESAEDALYEVDHLDDVKWHSLGASLQAIERYNGLGYQKRGLISPYLWSGTTLYSRGKYVRDGKFDPTAVDAQLGCAAILRRMEDRGIIQVL